MCIGQERERFERVVRRLLAYPIRSIVVEGTLPQIERGEYRSKVHPNAAIGSIMGWQAKGITFLFCENHQMAGKLTAKFLFSAARARYRESYAFLSSVLNEPEG